MDLLDHFEQAIEFTGHDVSRRETSILIDSIGLEIKAEALDRSEHNVNGNKSVVFQINVHAINQKMFPDGIWIGLAGFGANDADAFSYAAESWVAGVFWTIHEILLPMKTSDSGVECLDMLTRNEETREEFGWKFYVGPVQSAGGFFADKKLENAVLVKTLLGSISTEAVEKKLLWLSVFISKSSDSEIVGDCWLNNGYWIEGLNDLYRFAEEWEGVDSYSALKQFFIMQPCEISEIKNYEKLRKELPSPRKPSLLSRWFGNS